MSKGGSKQTVTQGLDASTQAHVNALRQAGRQAASAVQGMGPLTTGPQTMSIQDQAAQFFNPFQANVASAVRGEFDHLRNQAQMGTDQNATMAGAYGGARHGVASGVRAAELDRAQTSQMAGLLHSGWNDAVSQGTQYAEQQRQLQQQQLMEPLLRHQYGLNFLTGSMGPAGLVQSTQMPSNKWGSALGGAATGAAIGSAVPILGTALGAGIGGLGGLLFG